MRLRQHSSLRFGQREPSVASVEEAKEILKALGMPPAQHNEMSGLTLLALCGMTATKPWSEATRKRCTVTKGIMDYVREQYGADYAPNTRETFRRQVLHQFCQRKIADYNPFEPSLPTNSPRAHYAISEAALAMIRLYGSEAWTRVVAEFHSVQRVELDLYVRSRERHMVSVKLPNGRDVTLSPGKHNVVQKAILETFAPRFCPGAQLLYLGDTAKKDVFTDEAALRRLGISINEHGKLPDVLLYDAERNWLFLVEAVTSHGPMSRSRVLFLQDMLKAGSAKPVYVTAFPDFQEFRKHVKDIAWETEVWLCEAPEHMIHFNGDRFLGPR